MIIKKFIIIVLDLVSQVRNGILMSVCIFGGEKPRGVGILEAEVYEQGKGNGEGSLQANGDQGGWILSQLGGFQVSEGDRKGEQGELARGIKQGECIMYIVICVRVYK